mgnify:CR=1 FL=1
MSHPFLEYPKALYRNGKYIAVTGQEAEVDARKEGWTDWHEDHFGPAEVPGKEQSPEVQNTPVPPVIAKQRKTPSVAK